MIYSFWGFVLLLQSFATALTIRTDKATYTYGETIHVRMNTGQATGQWGYLSLEHYYNGRWYELDEDILTTGLKESPSILKRQETFAYPTRTIEPIRLQKVKRCRFVLKFGNAFLYLNYQALGPSFTINR